MARRDYKNAGARSGGKRGGRFGILFFGVLLGLAVAGVMAWYLLPRDNDFRKPAPAPEPKPRPVEPAPPAQPATPPANPSNYTFYDILPGDKAPKPLPPAKEQWWLQVAALKSGADADALRAKLTLLNLDVAVQATPGNPPLHRVRVGPFRSQDAAESAREVLILNKFEPRLLKEPVPQ